MKNDRQNAIISIISSGDIDTQEELIARLNEEGFKTTQATISRDIRDLKLIKVMTPEGKYKYSVSEDKSQLRNTHSLGLKDMVLSCEYSLNLIVIKTLPGMANAVAASIDSFDTADLLGSVAGDDCIIVVVKNPAGAPAVLEKLKNHIGYKA